MASETKAGSVRQYLEECLSASGLSADEAAGRCEGPHLSEFVTGEKTVPLYAVPQVAAAIGGDPMELFVRCVADYLPETYAAIAPRLEGSLTSDEAALIRHLRAWVGSAYLAALTDVQTSRLTEYLRALREPPGATRTVH